MLGVGLIAGFVSPSEGVPLVSFLVTKANSPSQFNIGMPPTTRFKGAGGMLSFKATEEELAALDSAKPGARGKIRISDPHHDRLLTDDGTLVLIVDARVMTHPSFEAGLKVAQKRFESVRDC